MIELPMPKATTPYKIGLEHAEIVVGKETDLLDIVARHKHLAWDLSGLEKSTNQDIRLQLKIEPSVSVKFHCLPLDVVIAMEIGK